MKKVELNGRMYNVCTIEEYHNNPSLYSTRCTAVETSGGQVLPLRVKGIDTGTGVYYQNNSMCCSVIKPSEDEADIYSADRVLDFNKLETIQDIIDTQQLIRNIQMDNITNSDNVLALKIGDKDTPIMGALKGAINSKRIDPNDVYYRSRFDQFQNDMRLLKGHSITLAKLASIADNFDIAVNITLRNKYGVSGTPNPMGDDISVNLVEEEE